MQVDVCEQWRDNRTLRCSRLTRREHRSFQYTGFEPLAYQPQDTPVRNLMFHETDQLFMVDRIKERADVGIGNPIYGRRTDGDTQCIQRIVLAAPWPESIREAEKLLLVHRVEYLDR